jgi:S-adenosylmethionine:tRNA ribosyltransferase-isomerase
MEQFKHISAASFDYELPDDRIARYPLGNREDSKLLVFDSNGIRDSGFSRIGEFLPEKALLVVNDTRVVRARLNFRKSGGAPVELFILEPAGPTMEYQIAFSTGSPVVWKCFVGNSKRWKSGFLEMPVHHHGKVFVLRANRLEKLDDSSIIEFSWDLPLSFAEVIEIAGEMPLPPYLGRKAEESDIQRYQTVFATEDGSVAAPTAGLHLTDHLVAELKKSGIDLAKLTLHVGAGTFKPLTSETIDQHSMHAERILVSRQTIQRLLRQSRKPVIAVGTTSMRSLESLYWLALKLKYDPNQLVDIGQWYPYENQSNTLISRREALQFLLDYLDQRQLETIQASTSIMIVPGYRFRIVDGLITNFHQPKSTLILLVSALIGDAWKDVYSHALNHNYRFLSYGDSCLFLPDSSE